MVYVLEARVGLKDFARSVRFLQGVGVNELSSSFKFEVQQLSDIVLILLGLSPNRLQIPVMPGLGHATVVS